jgi:hypothetical protein
MAHAASPKTAQITLNTPRRGLTARGEITALRILEPLSQMGIVARAPPIEPFLAIVSRA